MTTSWIRLAAIAVLSAGLMAAQGPSPRTRGTVREGEPPRGGGVSNFLATYLGLTDAQKTQAQAIFEAAATAERPLRDQLRQAHQALRDAAKANKSDAEIDQLAATVGNLTGQAEAIQTKAQAKFIALLTSEQRDKLDQLPGPRGPMGHMGPPMGVR